MPSRHHAVALATLATLGLATGCEKQNPIITMTAHGVVVKARAVRYCRGDDCRVTQDIPTLAIHPGDVLGIDVPRSLAEQGWKVGAQGIVNHDHYRAERIGEGLRPGAEIELSIFRDEAHGVGEWRFKLVVK